MIAASRVNLQKTEQRQEASNFLYLPDVSLSASYLRLDQAMMPPARITKSLAVPEQASQLFGSLVNSPGVTPAQLNSSLSRGITEQDVVLATGPHQLRRTNDSCHLPAYRSLCI